jgi:hypothetical protein
MFSSNQFGEHQTIEQTLSRDPTQLSLHNVKQFIFIFYFSLLFLSRHQNFLWNIYF